MKLVNAKIVVKITRFDDILINFSLQHLCVGQNPK